MYDEKYELDFGKIMKAISRFKKTGIVVGLVVMSAMVFGNKIVFPDKYEASALVRVKMDNILHENSGRDRLQIVQEEILGRTVLESVAKQLGMDQPSNGKKTLIQQGIELVTQRETALKPQSMDNIVRDLRSAVSIVETSSSHGGTNVFMVSMTDSNPNSVAQVVNAIIDTYINQKSSSKAGDTQMVVEFLQRQVDGKKQELMVVTKKLQFFKNANSKYLDSDANVANAIYNAKMRLVAAESRIAENQALVADTRESMQTLPATLTSVAIDRNVDPNNLSPQERLAFMEQRLTDFASRYTSDHPDVVRTRHEIKRLREMLGVNGSRYSDEPTVVNTANPEYLRLRSELSAAKSAYRSAVSEASLIRKELKGLEEIQSKLPQVHQMLATLEAAKENVERDYRNLQTRLTDAAIASQAAQTTVGSSFMVVDPAVTPTSPTVRSRLILHVLGVLMGIGVALGVSFVLGMVISEKETDHMNVTVTGDGDITTDNVVTNNSAGNTLFYITASVMFLAIVGYIIFDFLKQTVVFV